jgi:hypothetical protein
MIRGGFMKRSLFLKILSVFWAVSLFLGGPALSTLWACACGCGIFDVGTSSMFPTHPGGMLFAEFDSQNQNKNWSGSSRASADGNDDKRVRTSVYTVGGQYMLNGKWGLRGELPYENRYFKTATEDSDDVAAFDRSSLGDLRLTGIYSGFSGDMSSGLTFGLKLPTGDATNSAFDPDTQIGTGSTDLLLGGYHVAEIKDLNWNWFANGQWEQPVLHDHGYNPGAQINAALGTYYDHWKIAGVKVAPVAQVIESYHWRDGGNLATPQNSGYERLLLAPGLETDIGPVRIYGDVGFPVWQDVKGNQLIASELYKINISYHF